MPEKKLLSWSKAQQNISEKEDVDIHSLNNGYPQIQKVDILPQNVDSNISTNEAPVDSNISTNPKSGYPQKEILNIYKKDRHDKNREAFFARIDPTISKKIKLFCVNQKIDKQEFLELSAIHYLEHVDIHNIPFVDSLLSHEERRKMIWKCAPTIINLYLQYLPDNRWKARDDREAEKYNDVDIRLVELGILHALLRTEHKRIHSFKYFVEEIEENLAVPLDSETINMMLQRRRQQFQEKRRNLK
jgi:hypothetical protein